MKHLSGQIARLHLTAEDGLLPICCPHKLVSVKGSREQERGLLTV